MKFSEDRLNRLLKIVSKINGLDIGEFYLPERFGIFHRDGQLEAVLIWEEKFQKYEIELVDDEEKAAHEAHVEEIKQAEETEDRSKQI